LLNENDDRLNLDGNNWNDNRNNYAFGMALAAKTIIMRSYNEIYKKIISFENLILAWRKARKGKTKKKYVIEFEQELFCNLMALHYELKYKTYKPRELVTFVLRDPKTRVISKSDFRDRIIHHAICNIIEPIFDGTFIYDSCANRKGKGNLFALERFYRFLRKVTKNGLIAKNKFQDNNYVVGYCLKADIKHYFQEVNHKVLMNIISRKIKDKDVLWLIDLVLKNGSVELRGGERNFTEGVLKGMPLGNLTSQFFANVYLNELDYFVKHKLKAKYYIRYVDDFVILHRDKDLLERWKLEIDRFLRDFLKLELHPQKSRIAPLSRGIDFVGFRNFYFFRLLRMRNVRKMLFRIKKYETGTLSYADFSNSFNGWNAYSVWANTLWLRREILKGIYKIREMKPRDIDCADRFVMIKCKE